MPALAPAHRDAAAGSGRPAPGSVAAVTRGWLVALFAVSAGYAGAVALLSSSVEQQRWGMVAAPGYALAALAAAGWQRRGRDLGLLLSLGGGLLAPLGVLVTENRALREVSVVSRAAWLLIHHGTPYLSAAALAGTHNPDAYNPYLPAMAVFGLPRAIARHGPLTDPRIGFAAAFAVIFWLALRAAGTPYAWRWTALVAGTPVIGFPLAVGGDDVPVLGLMCLGLALLTRAGRGPRPVPAGLALGVAAAMKATAWPALLIAGVLVAARDGRRPAVRFTAAALAAFAVLTGPVAAVSPSALAVNTLAFPLGLAHVKSAATSPLPGFLLAQTGHAGHLIAAGLLVLAGLAVAASLVVRPPRDVRAATWRLIIALVLMFTLAPSTRFGYYIYPLGLWIWLRLPARGRHQSPAASQSAAPAPAGDSPEARAQAGHGSSRIRW